MKSLFSNCVFGHKLEDIPALSGLSATLSDPLAELSPESRVMKTLGWITAAVGAVALGLFVGRELRQRYKFNHRTPYDFYAHSGDDMQDVDFSLGI